MNSLGLIKKKRPRDIIYGKTLRELKPEVEQATKIAVARMFARKMSKKRDTSTSQLKDKSTYS